MEIPLTQIIFMTVTKKKKRKKLRCGENYFLKIAEPFSGGKEILPDYVHIKEPGHGGGEFI